MFNTQDFWIGAAAFFALIFVLALAAFWYAFALPSRSHRGPLPPLTDEERTLAQGLEAHVVSVASVPHNVRHCDALERAAIYIENKLREFGFDPNRQEYETDGCPVRNIEVIVPSANGGNPPGLVIGAHYDSAGDAPGANDNGTGAAAVLELARLLRDATPAAPIRLVLFVNEEPPYFQTPDMGSVRYARMLKERGERTAGMISLETLGCFSDAPGSQAYPWPLGAFFPTTANFIAFVAMPGSRGLLHRAMRSFRAATAFPTIGGVAPDVIPGIGWSDHWSFSGEGVPAIMITDTALFRYPHYHRPTDTPDKVDYEKLARITKGLERMIRDLSR